MIPSWAKTAGGLIVGTLLLAASFVSRYEYDAHLKWHEDQAAAVNLQLSDIRRDIKDILWRVGGPAGAQHLDANDDTSKRAWEKALRLAKIPRKQRKSTERPTVLVFTKPWYMEPTVETRWCGVTYAIYTLDGDQWKRQIIVMVFVRPAETDLLYKGLVHEFLHYTLGTESELASEQAVRAVWPYDCPTN